MYTVGHHDKYMATIAEYGTVNVKAKVPCFRDRMSADAYLRQYKAIGWAIFGLDGTWEKDSVRVQGKWFRVTNKAVPLLLLDDPVDAVLFLAARYGVKSTIVDEMRKLLRGN